MYVCIYSSIFQNTRKKTYTMNDPNAGHILFITNRTEHPYDHGLENSTKEYNIRCFRRISIENDYLSGRKRSNFILTTAALVIKIVITVD